jgi:hypothetical protein
VVLTPNFRIVEIKKSLRLSSPIAPIDQTFKPSFAMSIAVQQRSQPPWCEPVRQMPASDRPEFDSSICENDLDAGFS